MIILRVLSGLPVTVFLMLLSFHPVIAQEPGSLRSVLSTGGSSGVFTSGDHRYFFQQSIGQPGITGLSEKNSIMLRQGFLQPLSNSTAAPRMATLPAVISPNPFSSGILISVSEEIPDLDVFLYDLNGRLIWLRKFHAARELTIDMGSLPSGVYIIRLSAQTKSSYSKIFKL
jgi:hypothetical protein